MPDIWKIFIIEFNWKRHMFVTWPSSWARSGLPWLPGRSFEYLTESICCKWRSFNTLKPKQNGRHFPDDILKCFFFNENVWISIGISLKYVPTGQINNIPTLVQIMAWRRPGDKPLSGQWWLVCWRIYASLGLNELRGTHSGLVQTGAKEKP